MKKSSQQNRSPGVAARSQQEKTYRHPRRERWDWSHSFRRDLVGGRQRESKHCPTAVLVFCPKHPAVRLNDRARNRQAHPHAIGFSCEKGIEDVLQFVGGDPGPSVPQATLCAARSVKRRGQTEKPIPPARAVES